jgi:ABC-type nitrate/sulfonate/bicarbonate transport system substrate-binding protein
MKRLRRGQAFVLVGWLVVITAAAALLSWWRLARLPLLSVPVSPWPGYAYLALAAEKGLDQQQGIRIEVRRYADPQLILRDLAWGRLPLAQLTTAAGRRPLPRLLSARAWHSRQQVAAGTGFDNAR